MRMSMKIRIEVQTPDATVVRKAIEKEIESSPYKKTRTALTTENSSLIIEIESDDIRALRGTFNSYMNWLITILESLSLEG